MISMTRSVCIDAPVAHVWTVLSDLQAIQQWVPAIRRAHCPHQSRGVGAERVCEIRQGVIRETIVDWHEGHSFTYHGEGAPMMARATNRWSVEAHGARQTLVTTTAEAVLKGGAFARLLEPLARIAFQRMGAQSLASLKYFVEHGRAYQGRLAELPAPLAC
jgi:carbon monoxide dehydrogenase subunit G